MGFLRKLFGGGEKPQRGPGDGPSLTAGAVRPATLDPAWPVVPQRREVEDISAAERNVLPYEAVDCPSCGAHVASPPKGRKRCTSCGKYMHVRIINRSIRRLVTEAVAADLDRVQADQWEREEEKADRDWQRALVAAGFLNKPRDQGVDLDVVGESHYHANLAALMAALRADPEATEAWAAARLMRDPQNRYDKNAVRVEIHGRPVGYLSRNEAEAIQPWLKRVDARGLPAYFLARLGGGGIDNGRVGPIGVTLEGLPENALG